MMMELLAAGLTGSHLSFETDARRIVQFSSVQFTFLKRISIIYQSFKMEGINDRRKLKRQYAAQRRVG